MNDFQTMLNNFLRYLNDKKSKFLKLIFYGVLISNLDEKKQTAMFNKGKIMQVNITVLNMLKINLTAENHLS